LGPDSTPWVIDSGRATLTHRSAPGTTITFPLPTKGGNFTARTANSDIVTGPEGDLWLSQSDGPFVARVEPRETKAEYTRYRIPTVGEGTSLISNGPDGDIWFAGGSVIGSISTRRTEGGEVACAVPGCEGPIRALSKGPEGALWFALGSDLGRFRPPALHLRLPKGSPHRNGKTVPVAIECRGGAAGDICDGKVELLLRQGSHKAVSRPLGQARFTIRTMKRHKVTLRLSDRALRLLSAQGDLRVRLVATVAGKVVANRKYLLRGGR
jgi:hypothetical protein